METSDISQPHLVFRQLNWSFLSYQLATIRVLSLYLFLLFNPIITFFIFFFIQNFNLSKWFLFFVLEIFLVILVCFSYEKTFINSCFKFVPLRLFLHLYRNRLHLIRLFLTFDAFSFLGFHFVT